MLSCSLGEDRVLIEPALSLWLDYSRLERWKITRQTCFDAFYNWLHSGNVHLLPFKLCSGNDRTKLSWWICGLRSPMGAVQALCRLLLGVGVDGMELARVSMTWLHSPFLSFLIGTDVCLCSLSSPVAWILRGWALCSSYFMWLYGLLFRWICPLCVTHSDFFLIFPVLFL